MPNENLFIAAYAALAASQIALAVAVWRLERWRVLWLAVWPYANGYFIGRLPARSARIEWALVLLGLGLLVIHDYRNDWSFFLGD